MCMHACSILTVLNASSKDQRVRLATEMQLQHTARHTSIGACGCAWLPGLRPLFSMQAAVVTYASAGGLGKASQRILCLFTHFLFLCMLLLQVFLGSEFLYPRCFCIHAVFAEFLDTLPVQQFDAIHVGAAADEMPQPLLARLARGGRMVLPLGPRWGMQASTARFIRRLHSVKVYSHTHLPIRSCLRFSFK